MVVAGPRCTLRSFIEADVPALTLLLNNYNVSRNLTVVPHPYVEANAREWFERHKNATDNAWSYAIEANSALIGAVGGGRLENIHCRCIEFGYWLGEPFWGQGLATEAVGLFCDFLAQQPDVDRLQANVYGWNPASARVLEKNGFSLEGRRPRGVFKDGQTTDLLLYGRVL
jgi:RimJ/RimL family protein N-acetyltransferase